MEASLSGESMRIATTAVRRRRALGACGIAIVLGVPFAPTAPTAAGVPAKPSCRAALRGTPFEELPIPSGCRAIDRTLLVGDDVDVEGTGTFFLSVPGKPKAVVAFYRSVLRKADFDVEPPSGGGSKCTFETEVAKHAFTCAYLSFGTGTVDAAMQVLACGGRSQVSVGFFEPESPFPDVAPCLDPEGTGAEVEVGDARRYLRAEICEGASRSLYAHPAPTFSIDQRNSPPNVLNLGYEPTRDIESICEFLDITGVLQLTPDQVDWRLPAEYEQISREGRVRPDVWLRIGSSRDAEWVSLDVGTGAYTVGDPTREALEAFPVVKVKVTDSAGENDLILETSPVDDVGEGCVPGQEVSPFFQVSVRREGSGVGPATVQLEVTPPGGVAETRMLRWTRGLFPGESVGIGEFGPGTSLRLDPGGRVPELDEANNNGVLGDLSELTCVPV